MYQGKHRSKRKSRFGFHLSAAALAAVLSVTLLAQTVSAKTYVITDGDRVITYTTFATDPTEVLDQAGMDLREHDTFQAGGNEITVRRAPNVTIYYHGQTTRATSPDETVGELLSRLGMDVAGEDVVSHGMEDKVYDGMELTVERRAVSRETYSVAIPYETTYCNDPSIPEGIETVLTPGKEGKLSRTADVTYVNGRELDRVIIEETVTRNPVAEVISVGTGAKPTDPEAMPIIGDGYIILPSGETLTYSRKDHVRATAYTHTDAGCDLITATGTTVHWGTVAVDPRNIPYGTKMFIVANDGSYVYGLATAEDCGGDIKGDRMDLYMPTYQQCREFGRRRCTIYFLD